MNTQAQGSESTEVTGNGMNHSKPIASNPPSAQFTNGLLVASGTAFLTGIFGSLWYQGRQEKRKGISMCCVNISKSPYRESTFFYCRVEQLICLRECYLG
jgi:hypothetical protein